MIALDRPQSLTPDAFEQCRPVSGEGGRAARAFCPFHGSDQQRSLRLNRDTGRFACFACGAWGYLKDDTAPYRPAPVPRPTSFRPPPSRPVPAPPPTLSDTLRAYQAALPGSWGERYLRRRGIPLELAQRHGVGYAAAGTWLHRSRDWQWGRLVFPHTDPGGQVVNLYGRAVGSDAKVPRAMRHDHLPCAKGFFNATALGEGHEVHVCEGPFDALSLMAAGVPRAVAIFGVDGWNWDWVKPVRRLIFALDADAAGQRWPTLARGALLRGKQASFLELSCYGGCKDINEAWCRGVLTGL